MNIIEPCCYSRQLTEMMERLEKEGDKSAAHFFSNSDWGTDELLTFMATSVPGCRMAVCLVNITANTIATLADLMRRRVISHAHEKELTFLISHLTIITQPGPENAAWSQRGEIQAMLGDCIEQGRVTVCEDRIGFRCIAVANEKRHWVIQGSLNQQAGNATQLFTATVSLPLYQEVIEMLDAKAKVKSIFKKRKE